MNQAHNDKPLIKAGTFLGVGLGGFFDGILFHQILQLHEMLTGRIPKDSVAHIQINMFWDGVFHAFTWMMTVWGVVLLWRAVKCSASSWSARTFLGSLLLGWGLFNFIEGLIDHHLLHLHHVVETLGVSVFDYLFLASGLVFILSGWLLIRRREALVLSAEPRPASETG